MSLNVKRRLACLLIVCLLGVGAPVNALRRPQLTTTPITLAQLPAPECDGADGDVVCPR